MTTTIEPNDIATLDKINKGETIRVQSIDFKLGQVTFKDSDHQELMKIDDADKRILPFQAKNKKKSGYKIGQKSFAREDREA